MGISGVVLVSRFTVPGDTAYSGYIDYISRPAAVRAKNTDKYIMSEIVDDLKAEHAFDGYLDYMDDPKKTTELFTASSDNLTPEAKAALKDVYNTAQNNGSPMWQTVLSFEPEFLREAGVYDPETNTLNERILRNYTRRAMSSLLTAEGMQDSAVYSASIHYNTQHIHVHIAAVEPTPTREKVTTNKMLVSKIALAEMGIDVDVYDLPRNTQHRAYGKKSIPSCNALLNDTKAAIVTAYGDNCRIGNYLTVRDSGDVELSYTGEAAAIPPCAAFLSSETNYKGKIQPSSLEKAKSTLVNLFLDCNDELKQINELIRNNIVAGKKENPFLSNPEFSKQFLAIYNALPKDNLRAWQYKMNSIKDIRPYIDKLSEHYISVYKKDSYNEILARLKQQEYIYSKAYGGQTSGRNHYAADKVSDLKYRLGNAILAELKEYHTSRTLNQVEALDADMYTLDTISFFPDDDLFKSSFPDEDTAEEIFQFREIENQHTGFSSEYKIARAYLYGSSVIDREPQKAYSLFLEEHQKGNLYATHDLAMMHQKGIGVNIDTSAAETLYSQSLRGFLAVYNEKPSAYLSYRIGKMYYYGQGCTQDNNAAFSWCSKASEKAYAQYLIGNLYYDGKGVNQDYLSALDCYIAADNAYANYKSGYMYANGLGVDSSTVHAQEYYAKALQAFVQQEKKSADDNLQYRIGSMYLFGRGTEKNESTAISYFEKAAALKNDNARLALAQIYCNAKSDAYNIDSGLEQLVPLIKSKTEYVQCSARQLLAEQMLDKNNPYYDAAHGIQLLAENTLSGGRRFATQAQYRLGCYYCNPNSELHDEAHGIRCLEEILTSNEIALKTQAQYRLGKTLCTAQHTPDEQQRGYGLLLESNQSGNLYSTFALGMLHMKGDVLPRDLEKAEQYLQKCADAGNELAKNIVDNLGTYGRMPATAYAGKQYSHATGPLRELFLSGRLLLRSMDSEYENYKNQIAYQQLERQVEQLEEEQN